MHNVKKLAHPKGFWETGMEKTEAKKPYFSSFLTRIGGIFLAPEATFTQIITDKIGFWEPLLLVVLLFAIQGAVIASFASRILSAISESAGFEFSLAFLNIVLFAMITAMIIATLIAWVVLAGIAHLGAKYVFKGQGSFTQLMKLYGYAFVPYSLMIFGVVLFGLSWTLWPFTLFFNTLTSFWVVLLMATAVKQNYKLDIGKAFISSFIGPMLLWLAAIVISWAWMWLFIDTFTGGFL